MKLLIDNLAGLGLQDYTSWLDMTKQATLRRKLNRPSEMQFGLALGLGDLAVPVRGARIILVTYSGIQLFTGYASQAPVGTYIGWDDHGAVYRFEIDALSDVMLLDQKMPPPHPPFVNRQAGDAFVQLTNEALPNVFDLSGVMMGDVIPYFSVDPAKRWTDIAGEIAVAGRCCYRDLNGKLAFVPVGINSYPLAETDPSFSPSGLQMQSINRVINDLTVLGELEPTAHVKDLFVGDGVTSRFYLSQKPFTRSSQLPIYSRTIVDEVYSELDINHWKIVDPDGVMSVTQGQLMVNGGTGVDGATCLTFIEEIELGGATLLKHGDVIFNSASDGVIGGLYSGAVSINGCMAGFRVAPSGATSTIQALVGGSLAGTAITTQVGHHYIFSTQVYPSEIYRMEQVFHSSTRGVGNARGGAVVGADVRVVLEVQDINPGNPATRVAPATVLYDGVIANAPAFTTYSLVNAIQMFASIAFTYVTLPVDAVVRSTIPGGSTITILTGGLLDGAQCRVSTTPAVEFYPEFIPVANQIIEVSYRGQGHAAARVIDSTSVSALSDGADNGVRADIRQIALPVPRTSADCENAALTVIDDAVRGWKGEYKTWSAYLPGGAVDIFPGDGLAIDVQSREAIFNAIAVDVTLTIGDIASENVGYTLKFVDTGDPSLSFTFAKALFRQRLTLLPLEAATVENAYLDDLAHADFTNVQQTVVTIDSGFTPPLGGGIEVRSSDEGWGIYNDRNLIGRFTTSVFTLTRYARSESYFLKAFDNNSPTRYSRYSAALHVDFPLT